MSAGFDAVGIADYDAEAHECDPCGDLRRSAARGRCE